MAMACFDVFDTVLTRAVGSPASVFLLLGRRLAQQAAISCTPEAFARARIAAEQRLRSNVGVGRYTLREIYSELGAALQLAEPTWKALLREECALEAELARVVPEGRTGVEQARRHGERVVFVSDMYWPSCLIRKQLERHGLWKGGEACYVSCERGATDRA
jgi:predicted HAD superfamily hydrolase